VGHATLLTGSAPAYHGIIANNWYDRKTGKSVYCVEDPKVETVGGPSKPMSPKNLLTTTVGDELKMATNGNAKVVGIALKDRASILMAGHAADDVVWFDNESGGFVTSTWYAPNKELPAWVRAVNAERSFDAHAGDTWVPLLPKESYRNARSAPGSPIQPNGVPFAHTMPKDLGKKLNETVWKSPWGNELTIHAAEKMIEAHQLGKDATPDLIAIGLSGNDYVGHAYGPNSPEVMDMAVRTDRLLSALFNFLEAYVPGGIANVAIVVSADHGVTPIALQSLQDFKIPVTSGVESRYRKAINTELARKYGEGEYVAGDAGQNVYLDHALLSSKGVPFQEAAEAAAEAARSIEGVFNAFTRDQLIKGEVPNYPFGEAIANGYNAKMGGDLIVLEAPGHYGGGFIGTGHGSIWDYDAHVPILLHGRGIKPGKYLRRVYTTGIAPTLSKLLGIESPSGNVGVPLVDELERGPTTP